MIKRKQRKIEREKKEGAYKIFGNETAVLA